MLTRRTMIAGGAAAAGLLLAGRAGAQVHVPVFDRILQQLGEDARLGVAAMDTGNGHRLLHTAEERFAMCSTFKLPLAGAILSQVDAGKLSLDQQVRFSAADVLDYAPVVKAHLSEGSLSVGALCEAIITVSDNAAANLLLPLVAGPGGLTRWIRSHGDEITRLDRPEPGLNIVAPGDLRDTTTPLAMLGLADDLLLGDILGPASKAKLLGWMQASTTGTNLLRAGLPATWKAGDKSGRNGKGAVNNVLIAYPPAPRKPVLIACYLDAPAASEAAQNQAHVEVAKLVAQVFV